MNSESNNFNKYKYGKIYEIIEIDNYGVTKVLYIGSTCRKIEERFKEHLGSAFYNKDKKYGWKLYKYMRRNGIGYSWHYNIRVYEYYPCKSEEELKKYEYKIINLENPPFNFIKSYEDEKRIFQILSKKN